jgi:hypothetical protein
VTPVPPSPVVVSVRIDFWADRYTIYRGQSVRIYWSVEGIDKVFYQGEGVVGAGFRDEWPYNTSTYTLTIYKRDGTVEYRTVTINVITPY